jgi:thiamine biosynthesis lipoprotein
MRLLRTLFIFLCFVPTPAFPSLHEVREIHYQMGTFLELTLWHSEDRAAKRLIREVVGEVHRLEEILSNFDPESDVSRFNNLGGYGKANLHPDLYALLKIALTFSAKTNGYFDVTVGPLVDLWKESLALGLLPSPEVVAERLGAVGYGKLKLYDDGKGEFLAPDMKIDLGGIGKGYAVDRVADFLKRAAVTAALINFGGSSIYALGTPPDKRGWDIGIQGTDGKLRGVILLHDMGLSTSGSMGRFWTVAGNKYGHIINPKNGMPVNESRMATVISPSATAAEALSKPLGILGSGALSMTKEIPQSEAVVIPERGPLFFSSRFRSKTTWRELPAT